MLIEVFSLPKFFRNNKLIVTFSALIVFIALIGLSIRSNAQSPVEQYVGDSVSLGQGVISYPVQLTTGAITNLFAGNDNASESSKVKQLEAENERLKTENDKLKKELDVKDINKYDPISSTVIARNPDQWLNTIVVDKGSKAGVKNNMAVMTSDGLVGRVSKVNQFTSQVDLISTSTRGGKLSINIQHGSKNVFGLIEEYDAKTQELIISDIDNKNDVSKGDKVVTSGLAEQLPGGLYIGEITKVENDQYGLAKQVRVKTAADMSDLRHVYIAKRDPKTIPKDEGGDA